MSIEAMISRLGCKCAGGQAGERMAVGGEEYGSVHRGVYIYVCMHTCAMFHGPSIGSGACKLEGSASGTFVITL